LGAPRDGAAAPHRTAPRAGRKIGRLREALLRGSDTTPLIGCGWRARRVPASRSVGVIPDFVTPEF